MAAVSLLICDDSSLARKQLLQALPAGWSVEVSQAATGLEALERIRQGGVEVLLLDLTMPELDGYQVLAQLREERLSCKTIVISADVQDEAVRRVLELGALAFIRKPADPVHLHQTLASLGLLNDLPALVGRSKGESIGFRDAFREVVNVAMGRAAALLARVLGVFIQLPIPNVNLLEVGELHMALADAARGETLTAVCQGYIGGGIAGEALLLFHDSEVADMARLMRRQNYREMEMLLDLSSLLISACLSGIAEQIEVVFSQGHPQVLGQHASIDELIRLNSERWKKTLAVEFSYSLEGHDIHFDLLLLFTEDSVELLRRKLAYLMD
ncbi:response regulator [Stutzerimonas nitrititolerans]|uniref:response regulator n=1 Tax=Stutzerimonas nitrititolerans TaxID=2482751 RepID=UPI00026D6EE7|nr:response regulator [Stutzerimonas nitrititolerans]AFN77868.1 response regulator [Stutzerimonas stutzeri DSM 10701]HAQ25659.1 response regulator [Pseudomonas sp.]NNT95702.1 response regulator [Stutzerimonas nitrititolerans]HBB77293.1 response regulator [Pseudomonas sp.]HCL76461.1 response regulator [Pseudomonas sp.]